MNSNTNNIYNKHHNNTYDSYKFLISVVMTGVIALAITIGISRFGFSVLIGSVLKDEYFTERDIGIINTYHLLGYVIGCVVVYFMPIRNNLIRYLQASIFICISSILLLYKADTVNEWSLLRFICGVSGGIVFILVSNYLSNILNDINKKMYIPFLYCGVGLGVMLSSLSSSMAIDVYRPALLAQASICIILFLFLSFFSSGLSIASEPLETLSWEKTVNHFKDKKLSIFAISYMLEGMGYIIYMTYIFPHNVDTSNTTYLAEYSFFILGFGAFIGVLLLPYVLGSITIKSSIVCFILIQILSVIIVYLTTSPYWVFLSSLFFGISFMGITASFISYANDNFTYYFIVVALITVLYSIGQLLGSVSATYLNEINEGGGYGSSILLSCAFMILSLTAFFYSNHIISRDKLY